MKTYSLIFLSLMIGYVSFAQNTTAFKEYEAHLTSLSTHHTNSQNDRLRSPNAINFLNENFDTGIPATWTIVDNLNAGGAVWAGVTDYQSNTLDGTPFVMADSDAAGQNNTDTELISPVIDTSTANALYLSFDQYYNTYSGNDTADVDVFNGSQWINVYSNNNDIGNWGDPDFQVIDVTAYKNSNFKVRFHYYNANWEYFWAIDNIIVFEPDNNDLAVIEAQPQTYIPNSDIPLDAVIFNAGIATQDTFDVNFNILDSNGTSLYNETINVTGAGIGSGEKYTVAPSNLPNLPVGQYVLNVSVDLSSDTNNSNDTYSIDLHIIDYVNSYDSEKVYSYIAYDADISGDLHNLITFDNMANISTLATVNSNNFFVSGTFVNGILTAVEYNTNMLYFISGNGEVYPFRKITGDIDTEEVTGIAYDNATNSAYVSTGTKLFQLNFPDLSTTLIGSFNISGFIIGIDIDNNGTMYGIDLGNDTLNTIDTTSGIATAVGPLGIDIRFAQDIGIEPSTGNLYGTLYEDGIGSGLYYIDKITGNAYLIGNQQFDEYTVCAIKDTFIPCYPPTNLSVSNITPYYADLSWTDTNGGMTPYIVKWRELGFPSWNSYNTATGDTFFHITGLSPHTHYEWQVLADCSYNVFSSPAVGPEIYTWFCDSVPSSYDGNGITLVNINSSIYLAPNEVYHDFTNDIEAYIMAGDNNLVQLTFETGVTYDTNIWIDFNDDLIFDTATELVYSGESLADNPTTLDASFYLAPNVLTGFHYMRIGAADTGQNPPDPCYNGASGVTFDFSIYIMDIPPCPAPTNLAVSNITYNSAELTWTDNVNGGAPYYISWRPVGAATGETVATPSGTTYYQLTDLMENTEYTWSVTSDCGVTMGTTTGPNFTTLFNSIDLLSEYNFNFYPNPVHNNLKINADSNINSVQIFDLLGQEVLNVQINKPQDLIDTHQLRAGTYILKVNIDNNTGYYRFVKQ